MEGLPDRLRLARESREATLSQEDAGKLVGRSRQAVADWESGKVRTVPANYVAALCEATGVSPSWLLFGRAPMMDQPADSEMQRLQLVRAIVTVTEQVPDGTVSDWLEVVETLRAQQRDAEARRALQGDRSAGTG